MPELIDEVLAEVEPLIVRRKLTITTQVDGRPAAAAPPTARGSSSWAVQLTVRSALGEGATFTLTLPRWPRDDR
jgi:hypothetical protein